MTKQSALKQLDTILGKLSKLNYHLVGSELNSAVSEVSFVRDKVRQGDVEIRKQIKPTK